MPKYLSISDDRPQRTILSRRWTRDEMDDYLDASGLIAKTADTTSRSILDLLGTKASELLKLDNRTLEGVRITPERGFVESIHGITNADFIRFLRAQNPDLEVGNLEHDQYPFSVRRRVSQNVASLT